MNPKLIFMKNALERFFYVVDVFKTSFKRLVFTCRTAFLLL